MSSFFTALVVASAAFTVCGACGNAPRVVYVFKPSTTLLIILLAAQPRHGTAAFYGHAVVAGLVFSLAGDVFLMLPRDRFVAGLVSFLFAHLCYVAAFTSGGARELSPSGALGAVVLLAYGALMLWRLWPGVGKLKVPVVVYVLVILLMAWQAWNRWLTGGHAGSGAALAGALLFVASDSALAVERFAKKFRGAQAFVLGTYFAAQWLIAVST